MNVEKKLHNGWIEWSKVSGIDKKLFVRRKSLFGKWKHLPKAGL